MVCLSIDMLNVGVGKYTKMLGGMYGNCTIFNQMFGEGPALYMGNFACFGSQCENT